MRIPSYFGHLQHPLIQQLLVYQVYVPLQSCREIKAKWQSLEGQTEKPIKDTWVRWDSCPFLTSSQYPISLFWGTFGAAGITAVSKSKYSRQNSSIKLQFCTNSEKEKRRRKFLYEENRQARSILCVHERKISNNPQELYRHSIC